MSFLDSYILDSTPVHYTDSGGDTFLYYMLRVCLFTGAYSGIHKSVEYIHRYIQWDLQICGIRRRHLNKRRSVFDVVLKQLVYIVALNGPLEHNFYVLCLLEFYIIT